MRVLRDELLQLLVATPEPVCFAAGLALRRLEPGDLTLEAADLVGERVDGALLRVRRGGAVEGSGAESFFKESKHGCRAALVCLVDLQAGRHRRTSRKPSREETPYIER